MAEAAAERQSGFDRFNETLRNLDEDIQDFRERLEKGRTRLETQLRKRAERVRTELRKSEVYRRAEQLRKDVEDQVGRGRAQIYDVFGLATKADIDRLTRKVNQLNRRLNELAKEGIHA
jgi:polyhydroxyalkanoate synthesis regulator phasin